MEVDARRSVALLDGLLLEKRIFIILEDALLVTSSLRFVIRCCLY